MSLLANIDHLAIAAGIEAVVVESGSREYRGAQNWHPVLDGALDLFKRTEEKSIRLVVGTHTIVVQREGNEAVGVVLPTGHAIAKSLRRMIRRMARKNRGPIARPKPELVNPVATAPAVIKPTNTSLVTTPPAAPAGVGAGSQSTPPSGGQLSVAPTAKPAEEPKPNTSGQAGPSNPSASTDRGTLQGY